MVSVVSKPHVSCFPWSPAVPLPSDTLSSGCIRCISCELRLQAAHPSQLTPWGAECLFAHVFNICQHYSSSHINFPTQHNYNPTCYQVCAQGEGEAPQKHAGFHPSPSAGWDGRGTPSTKCIRLYHYYNLRMHTAGASQWRCPFLCFI